MHTWIPIEALWWLALYGGCGVLLPWLLRWTQKGRQGLDLSPRILYQRGELGLFGVFLGISAVVDLQRSALPIQLVVVNSAILALSGLMAGSVWLEDYSRMSEGLDNADERTWVDSRKLMFLVFSVAFATEVLLEHSMEISLR